MDSLTTNRRLHPVLLLLIRVGSGVAALALAGLFFGWLATPMIQAIVVVAPPIISFFVGVAVTVSAFLSAFAVGACAFISPRKGVAWASRNWRRAAAVLILVFAVRAGSSWRASEDYLEWNFARHRTDLEQLVRMLREDRVGKILRGPGGEWINFHSVPEARWAEYQRLCNAVDARKGVYHRGKSAILFVVWEGGFAGHSWQQGYAWSEEVPNPEKGPYPAANYRYRKLEGNWYLYDYDQG